MATTAAPDFNALLAKVQSLESDNHGMREQLSSFKQREEAEKASRSKEMQSLMSGFDSWVDNLGVDDETKRLIKEGMRSIAAAGDNSCIFKTFITASQESETRASQIEALRIENEALKKRAHGGEFASDDARLSGTKRAEPEATPSIPDVWSDAEKYFREQTGAINS